MKLDSNALWKTIGIGAGGVLVLSLLRLIPIVGIACCCLVWLGYAGIGVLYGVFARKNGTEANPGMFALGGAIGAAAGGLISGLVSGIQTLIVGTAGMYETLYMLEDMGMDVPYEMYDLYSTPGIGIGGALLGVCGAIFFGAAVGAIGGAVYAAIVKDKPLPDAPIDVVPPAE